MKPSDIYAPVTIMDSVGRCRQPALYVISPPGAAYGEPVGHDAFCDMLLTERWIPVRGRLVRAEVAQYSSTGEVLQLRPRELRALRGDGRDSATIESSLEPCHFDAQHQDYEAFMASYQVQEEKDLWTDVAISHDMRKGYILRPDGYLVPRCYSSNNLALAEFSRHDTLNLGHGISCLRFGEDRYTADRWDAMGLDPLLTVSHGLGRSKKPTSKVRSAGTRVKAEIMAPPPIKPSSLRRARSVSPTKPASAPAPRKRAASPCKPVSRGSPKKVAPATKPASTPSPKKAVPSAPLRFSVPPVSLMSPTKPASTPSPSRASPTHLTRSVTRAGLTGPPPPQAASTLFPSASAPVAGPSKQQISPVLSKSGSGSDNDNDAPVGYTHIDRPLGVSAFGTHPTTTPAMMHY